jgi:hypothetical protein
MLSVRAPLLREVIAAAYLQYPTYRRLTLAAESCNV